MLLIGLTVVSPLWDLPRVSCQIRVFGSGCCWSVIGLFGVVLLGFV
jgi:hypothetical protein